MRSCAIGCLILAACIALAPESATGSLLNVTITSPPFNVTNLTSASTTGFNVSAGQAAHLIMETVPVGDVFGAEFETQPALHLVDRFGNFADEDSMTNVTAKTNDPNNIQGTTTVTAHKGNVDFTDLGLSQSGSFNVEFNCSTCANTTSSVVTTRLVLAGGVQDQGRILSIDSSGQCSDIAPALPYAVKSVASTTDMPVFGSFGDSNTFGGLVLEHRGTNSANVYHGLHGAVEEALVIEEGGTQHLMLGGSFRLGVASLRNFAIYPSNVQGSGMLQPPCVKSMVRESANDIYVGGCFTQVANGTAVNGIAKLHNGYFIGLNGGVTKNGGPGVVHAMSLWNSTSGTSYLLVGGDFTHAGGISQHGFAAWNINTNSWMTLSGSWITGGIVYSMGLGKFGGQDSLVLGGDITLSSSNVGIATVSLAGAAPSAPTPFNGGVSVHGTIFSILSRHPQLIVGGNFTRPTHTSNLLMWTGSSFTPLNGCADAVVFDMDVLRRENTASAAGMQSQTHVAPPSTTFGGP